MPNTPGIIREQLNLNDDGIFTWESAASFGLAPKKIRVTKGPAAFPRIDTNKK
jgi:hypothetical protein